MVENSIDAAANAPGAIHVDLDALAQLVAILEACIPCAEVRAFGSRVTGTPRAFSDLDLLVLAGRGLTLDEMAVLREALSESALPFRVDLVDAAAAEPAFLARVLPGSVRVKAADIERSPPTR